MPYSSGLHSRAHDGISTMACNQSIRWWEDGSHPPSLPYPIKVLISNPIILTHNSQNSCTLFPLSTVKYANFPLLCHPLDLQHSYNLMATQAEVALGKSSLFPPQFVALAEAVQRIECTHRAGLIWKSFLAPSSLKTHTFLVLDGIELSHPR